MVHNENSQWERDLVGLKNYFNMPNPQQWKKEKYKHLEINTTGESTPRTHPTTIYMLHIIKQDNPLQWYIQ